MTTLQLIENQLFLTLKSQQKCNKKQK